MEEIDFDETGEADDVFDEDDDDEDEGEE